MFRDQLRIFGKFPDVAMQFVVIAKICPIGLLSEPVPLGSEDAVASNPLEADTQSANPRKQVDKPELQIPVSPEDGRLRTKLRENLERSID